MAQKFSEMSTTKKVLVVGGIVVASAAAGAGACYLYNKMSNRDDVSGGCSGDSGSAGFLVQDAGVARFEH